jgi:hypothetical protein
MTLVDLIIHGHYIVIFVGLQLMLLGLTFSLYFWTSNNILKLVVNYSMRNFMNNCLFLSLYYILSLYCTWPYHLVDESWSQDQKHVEHVRSKPLFCNIKYLNWCKCKWNLISSWVYNVTMLIRGKFV